MDDGEVIKSFKGTITDIWEPKEIGGKFPKKIQNCKVSDEDGDIMYLSFAGKSNQQYLSVKGKTIVVNCSKGKDGGFIGVKKKVEGDNNQYHKIWVTDTAKIYFSVSSSTGSSKSSGKNESSSSGSAGGAKMIVIDDEQSIEYAKAWTHTYKVVHPIFSAVLSDDKIPERVTAILISAGYNQRFLIAGKKETEEVEDEELIEDDDEKEVDIQVTKDKKLSDFTPSKWPSVVSFLYKKSRAKDAMAVAYLLLKEGDIEDVATSVAKSHYKDELKKLSQAKDWMKDNKIKDASSLVSALAQPLIKEHEANAELIEDDDEFPI